MTERVVGVVRLSLWDDASTSVERQREEIRRCVESRGAELVGFAEDVDVSASKVRPWDRPELGEVLRDPSGVDALVFWRLDRLVRSASDFHELVKWGQENGVNLVSATEPIDLQTPMGRLLATVVATFAEMESAATSERVKSSQAHLLQVGRWRGGALPYGNRAVEVESGGWRLAEEPESAAVVREVVRRVIEGESVQKVATDLSDRGIPTPEDWRRTMSGQDSTGARWRPTSLRRLLRSATLRGHAVSGGRTVTDEAGDPVRYGAELADTSTWVALQAALDGRSSPKERPRSNTPMLNGVAFCATCGQALYLKWHRPKGKPPRRTMVCASRNMGQTCEQPVTVAAEALEGVARDEFLRLLGGWQVLEEVTVAGVDNRAEIADLEARIADLDADRDAGLFRTEREVRRYRERMSRLSGRLEELAANPYVPASVEWVPAADSYGDRWEVADTAGRRELMQSVGFRLDVRPAARGSRDVRQRVDVGMGTELERLWALHTDDWVVAEGS